MTVVGGVAGDSHRPNGVRPMKRYTKRESRLDGMPVLTPYQAAFRAQRRAIAKMAAKTQSRRVEDDGNSGIQMGTDPLPPLT